MCWPPALHLHCPHPQACSPGHGLLISSGGCLLPAEFCQYVGAKSAGSAFPRRNAQESTEGNKWSLKKWEGSKSNLTSGAPQLTTNASRSNRRPERLPKKSEELFCYDCPCSSGPKCSPALEAGLAGPFPRPWLALFVFSPLIFQRSFPMGSHSGLWLRQFQESLAQHATNSFQTHSQSLNLLFSIYSKWLPHLCLLTHCLEPCPLSRLLHSTPRETPSHQSCAWYTSLINLPHLPRLWRTRETQMASSPARAAGFDSSRARTVGSEVLPAQPCHSLVVSTPCDVQKHFSITLNSLQAPHPWCLFLAIPCTTAVYTPHTPKLDPWALSKHVHASLSVWPWHSLFPEESILLFILVL